MFERLRHLRIFLSSPGDVLAEREIAFKVIEQLQYESQFKDSVFFEVVAWDKPGAETPMLANQTPQAAIDAGLASPADCDIVVVIFWARMGTPLPFPEYKKENGEPYHSGAEWEFENATQAHGLRRRPVVVVYRRTEEVLLDHDAPDYAQTLAQERLVEKFFAQFKDAKTGANKGGINSYQKPENFREHFTVHLRKLAEKIIAKRRRSELFGIGLPGITAVIAFFFLVLANLSPGGQSLALGIVLLIVFAALVRESKRQLERRTASIAVLLAVLSLFTVSGALAAYILGWSLDHQNITYSMIPDRQNPNAGTLLVRAARVSSKLTVTISVPQKDGISIEESLPSYCRPKEGGPWIENPTRLNATYGIRQFRSPQCLNLWYKLSGPRGRLLITVKANPSTVDIVGPEDYSVYNSGFLLFGVGLCASGFAYSF